MAGLGSFSITFATYLFTLTFLHDVSCNYNIPSGGHEHHWHKIRRRRLSVPRDERFLKFRFLEEPADVVAIDGRAELKCRYIFSVENLPNAYTVWLKDNTPIDNLHPDLKPNSRENDSVVLEKVSISTEGSYQCRVTVNDKMGTWKYLSRKATVRLPFLSRFEKQPQSRNVTIGESVAFECILTAVPPPLVHWYHENRILREGSEKGIKIFPVTGTLEIFPVQYHHQGSYKCSVTNGITTRNSEIAFLKVDQRAAVSVTPSFMLEPRASILKSGSSFVLECLVNGVHPSAVHWQKNSAPLGADGQKVYSLGTSSLQVVYASANDGGMYTCSVGDSDSSMQRSALIQVNAPPAIVNPPKDMVAQETADAEFECVVTGLPGALVSWFKNGEAIITSEYFMVEGNRLRILGLVKNDQGVYQCTAENDAGFSQASAQLIVESADSSFQLAGSDGRPKLPSEPLGLRATSVGSRFVTLTWDQPLHTHGSIIIYHVYYKESGSERERNVNSSGTTCVVPSLQPNVGYQFRVVAVNEAGPGKSSKQISIWTLKEQAVPGKVRNLRARAVSAESIELSWEPPARNPMGVEVKNYILFYIRADDATSERETQITTGETTHTLHGMDKYTDYKIRVEAEGLNGPGLSSDVISVKTSSDAPSGAPTNLRAVALSSRAIQITWGPVPPDERNGLITGYRLKFKPKNHKATSVTVSEGQFSYTAENLEPGTEYNIRIAAVNVNGTGPNSEPVREVTLVQDKDEDHPPPSPQRLILHPSATSILVIWDPPADTKTLVREYSLGWGPSIPDIHHARLDVGARNYTLTNLDPNREYVVSLRAVNKRGPGLPLYETASTSDKPSLEPLSDLASSPSLRAPVEVRAETISSSSILVSWTDLDHYPADERIYTVRCSSNSERSADPKINRFTSTQGLMEGLYPNTQYECVVRVDDGDYFSSWSMTAVNRTYPTPPSSAPCDLTVIPSNNDPQTVTLSWQPPKYANGDINEYVIYYTYEKGLPDEKWTKVNVEGNQMTYTFSELLPRTGYRFKIQAKNSKGPGPLSKELLYNPEDPAPRQFQVASVKETVPSDKFLSSSALIGVGAATMLLLLILILLVIWCVRTKDSRKGTPGGYVPGKKTSSDGRSPPDLWINHSRGHHVKEFPGESPSVSSSDLKRVDNALNMVDAVPSSRYQTNGHVAPRRVSSALGAYSGSSALMSQSTLEPRERRLIGIAEAIPIVSPKCGIDDESNGTLTRSYHQSSSSLESRQRTPQVVYTGTNRYMPSAKVDYSDHGSSYGSSQALQTQTPPPQLPNQGPPSGPPSQISDGYRTLRGTPINNSNPLKSFTQLAGAPPPLSPSQMERAAHIVRPVVIASPCSRGKPAGVVIGQKSMQVPVGRATAQPRVNVNNIYSSYTPSVSSEKALLKNDMDNRLEAQPLQQSNSTEELNAQMENLDTMIDDLQAMQHEFSAAS